VFYNLAREGAAAGGYCW